MENQCCLTLIKQLFEQLDKEEIIYCHWKSNTALDRSASGENDLDLLIHRAHISPFLQILSHLDFKQAKKTSNTQMPGIHDFWGYDKASDRFVHVHVHYQLVIGNDFTKNYHLPVEIPYLGSCVQEGIFKVPSSEFELILFVIRMVLKHSTWDTLLGRQGALSDSEKSELNDLTSRADKARIHILLLEHLPFISGDFFDECLRSIQPGCSLWKRRRIGADLQRRLKAFSRRSRFVDQYLKIWRRVIFALERRISKKKRKMRLVDGGCMIAVIGGDGAGKTTVVKGLQKWLSKHFDTKKIHLGKPQWSRTTIIVRGILKIGRILGLYPFEKAPGDSTDRDDELFFPGYPWLFRSICTARDRYLTYAKARRFASNGGLVICDRFPLPYLSNMESPRFTRFEGAMKDKPLFKYFVELEKKYYQSILVPEVVIVLKVDPQIAIQRKQEEDEDFVRTRSEEVWNFDWNQTTAHVIDASHSQEAVLEYAKAIVWSHL